MVKGIVIKDNGLIEIKEVEDKLHNYQEIVDGLIDYVSVDNGVDMIIDDEGKLKNKPVNAIATLLLNWNEDFIVGDVFIVGVNKEGETISLTDKQIQDYKKRILRLTFLINSFMINYTC